MIEKKCLGLSLLKGEPHCELPAQVPVERVGKRYPPAIEFAVDPQKVERLRLNRGVVLFHESGERRVRGVERQPVTHPVVADSTSGDFQRSTEAISATAHIAVCCGDVEPLRTDTRWPIIVEGDRGAVRFAFDDLDVKRCFAETLARLEIGINLLDQWILLQ